MQNDPFHQDRVHRSGTAGERYAVPERSPTDVCTAFLILVASFFYLFIFRRYSGVDPDEGIILQGAQRLIDGHVLYRDFFSFFTPGSYYLFALVFRTFGDSYLVAHTALAFIGALLSPITYMLARRVCSRQASLLVTALMTITAVPWRFVVIHNWDSTLFACLAIYAAVRFVESSKARWNFATFTFTALTALFEQSKGGGLFLGVVAGLLLIELNNRRRGEEKDRQNLFSRFPLLAAAVGFIWPFLVTVIYFASHHALREMLASWFWPLQHYSGANHVSYAYDNLTGQARDRIFATASFGMRLFAWLVFSSRSWIPYLPLAAILLLFKLLGRRQSSREVGRDLEYYVLVSSAIVGLLTSIVIARADYLHFIYLQPIFFLILAWVLDGRGIRPRALERVAPVIGLCLTMSLLAMAAQALFSSRGQDRVATRRGEVSMAQPDAVIPYVQAHVAPGERMLIYPYNSTYYYLTQTNSPTRFDFYQAGMHTEDQMQEMLREFSAQPTRAVLFEPNFNNHLLEAWPNTSLSAIAHDSMAEYIKREYHRCVALGPSIEFWIRNDLECPRDNE